MTASPASALSWQLWGRQRWPALGISLYVLGLALAAHHPEALRWSNSIFLGSVPLAFVLLFFVATFAYPEGDLLGRGSTFPAEQFLLPVRTSQLVFWPMGYAAASIAAAWIGFVHLLLRPLGMDGPVWWPAVMLAATMAWLQVLLWMPLGLPYLRVGLALTLIPGLIIAGVSGALQGVSPPLLTTIYLAALAMAYLAAVGGVTLARRGDTLEWSWLADRLSRRVPPAARAIQLQSHHRPSPERSQLWFEWRSSGLTLPFVTAIVFVLLSLPLIWVRELTPLEANPPRSAFGNIEVNLWLRLQGACLFWPPLLAAILGFGRRTYDMARRDFSLSPFLATRPLTETAFASARLRAAGVSTLVAWAVTLAFTCGWLCLPARDGERVAPLALLFAAHCPPATLATLLLIVILLIFWTWKNLVQGMYADLSGRSLLVYGAPLLTHSVAIVGMLAFINGPAGQTEMDPQYRTLPETWSTLLLTAVAVKAIFMLGSVTALYRMRLVSGRRLGGLTLGWVAVAAGSFGALHWIATAGVHSSALAGQVIRSYLLICAAAAPAELHSPRFLAATVLLFLPFNRIAWLPLMLRANRLR